MDTLNGLPEIAMFVGVPAGGKSTKSREYREKGYVILSSDDIRAAIVAENPELMHEDGNNDRLHSLVFEEVRKKAVTLLKSGVCVVVDATNLRRKKRMAFIRNLGSTPCRKKCVLFITPREICLERNARREGVARVPDEAMKRMFSSFECPGYYEGWDEIEPVIQDTPYRFPFEETYGFEQDNIYHSLTLHGHLDATRKYAQDKGFPPHIVEVAYYHDIGKLYVKEFKNRRGEATNTAHYYDHENYSAYLYLTEKCCGRELTPALFEDILYKTQLINCHMRPMNFWRNVPKGRDKDKALFGERFIADIDMLHEADRAAHREVE